MGATAFDIGGQHRHRGRMPAVLIVDDDAEFCESLTDSLSGDSLPVLTADSGRRALEILNRNDVGLVISDLHLDWMGGKTLLGEIRARHPSLPAVLTAANGSIEDAVDVMRRGASDYRVKPLAANDLRQLVGKYLRTDCRQDLPIAVDPVSRELLRVAGRVALTAATVTLSGESGCGKEIVARYIHDQSPRREQPFVAINCAAIPENMLEAVLFGYEKGAFTGATAAHAGKFEQAQGGTLLLDEISEMDLGLQAKILRVLQEREIERLGGRTMLSLDVRVLTTTNRDLRQDVANGKFREDLYYRLNVFPLHIPPLRDRREDILPLAAYTIALHSGRRPTPVGLSSEAEEKLVSHTWPGNVRELENLVQRSLILLAGDTIEASDLAFEQPSAAGTPAVEKDLHEGLRYREYQLIVEALLTHGGKRNVVAETLGISPRTLRYKLARLRDEGIDIPGERP